MGTNITSLGEMQNQGNDIVNLAQEFGSTVDEIYYLYDALRESWTGEKSDEYKRKIEELREPLKVIIDTVKRQGSAVGAAAEAFQKYERM
ncbi:MAG: WXG100 family type VII secretion target [Bacilli bacterium]|nr:WXG100 family type VII secretion target [Bacilli bacterium]